MYFRISIRETNNPASQETGPVTLTAENWYEALVEGLTVLEQPLTMQDLSFSVLDDGVSAIVHEREGDRRFEVIAFTPEKVERRERPSTPIPKTMCCDEKPSWTPPAPQDPDATAKMSPIPEDPDFVPTMAEPESSEEKPDTFTRRGPHTPGQTDAYLTHAFMNLSELYQKYPTDRVAAAGHLLRFTTEVSDSSGGGVLFFDINRPDSYLDVVAASGPARDNLLGQRVKIGQGPIGVCANLGVSLNIKNLAQELRYDGGVLTKLGLDVGPMICVPIHGDEWLQGVIMLYKHRDGERFGESVVGILEHVASTFGSYLHLSQRSPLDEGTMKKTKMEGITRR